MGVWCCWVDVDNPYVLVVEIEIEKRYDMLI